MSYTGRYTPASWASDEAKSAAAAAAAAGSTYEALARAQSEAGKNIALVQGALNRPTEVNPYSNKTWKLRDGADINNPQAGDWIVTETLNAPQQQLLNNSVARAGEFGTLASRGLAGLTANGLDTGFDRRATEDALYRDATRYFGERFQNDEAAIRDRLVNQGLDENSAAFGRQVADFTREKNNAYATAADNAIFRGGDAAIQNQQILRGGLANISDLHTLSQPTVPQLTQNTPVGNWAVPDLLGAKSAQDTANANAASLAASKSNGNKSMFGNLLGAGVMALAL